MSRIGKKPIKIPTGVVVEVKDAVVYVKGPKGELNFTPRPEIGVKVEDSVVNVQLLQSTKESKAYWGLTRSLIANMIQGVVDGFEKELEVVGIGYRVTSSGSNKITFAIGYSHPIDFEAPEGITLEVDDKIVKVKGIDKHLVGQTAANIRKIRKPEPYKGKGIKYKNEVVRRKSVKAAVK